MSNRLVSEGIRGRALKWGVVAVLVMGAAWVVLAVASQALRPKVEQEPGGPAQLGRDVAPGRSGFPLVTPEKSVTGSEPSIGSGAGGDTAAAVAEVLPPLDRVIKTASLSVRVKKESLDAAFGRATAVADSFGGYVTSSSTSNGNSADLVIRVPARSFDKAVAQLKRIGKATRVEISGQDVTDEYVDLNSRLRHWRAQEAVLLSLMAKAKNVAESMAVQQSLAQVQLQIEQITGRLNYLENQTAYATIHLGLFERVHVVRPDRWGLKAAFERGVRAFMDTLSAFVVIVGYAAPFAILALPFYIYLRRRVRTTGTA